MIRQPPRSTRTDTLFPYTTLFRSEVKTRRVPAKAGTHLRSVPSCTDRRWTPAFAGEHGKLNYRRSLRLYANPVIFFPPAPTTPAPPRRAYRSEEHTSELQSLMRISYAVFCLKKKKTTYNNFRLEHEIHIS